MNSRVCKHCGIEKSLEEFNKHKGGKFGRRPECKSCTSKTYYENQTSRIESSRNWQSNNKEKSLEITKDWRENNKKHITDYGRNYCANRKKEDDIYKLKVNLRNLIYIFVKKKVFTDNLKTKTANILGCSTLDFKKHLESKFKEDMSFENYGEWELDHIKPLKLANTETEVIELFHYSNLQPLWTSENREKGITFNKVQTTE